MREILVARRPSDSSTDSLLAITGQSNVTGHRPNLSTVVPFARLQGFDILLDAAALASSSRISLRELNSGVDAMAVSFYKMFGYPTGVGALVARKSFLAKLRKPYFSGGTVEVVQVPGTIVHESSVQWERFEEGTLNYTTLPAIANGVQFLQKHLPSLPARLGTLHCYLYESLSSLRYANGAPVVKIHTAEPIRRSSASPRRPYRPLTPPATPERETNPFDIPANPRQSNLQGSSPTLGSYGYVLACTFLSPAGDALPLPFISHHAATSNISLRTGCVCNPGGTAALLGMQEKMECIEELIAREGWKDEVGVVRLSLGIGSDFEDVWKVVQWAKGLTTEKLLKRELTQWKMTSKAKDAHARAVTMYALALLMYFYGALVVLFSTSI
jgi:selenocysteine lyase/cysteine desulfurase